MAKRKTAEFDEVKQLLEDRERGVRSHCLNEALRLHGHSGDDSVVRAAIRFEKYITTGK